MRERVPVDKVVEIAEAAGAAILEVYNSGEFGEETKRDNSPLTRADTAANDVICRGLVWLRAAGRQGRGGRRPLQLRGGCKLLQHGRQTTQLAQGEPPVLPRSAACP
jgi:hypothetical protein